MLNKCKLFFLCVAVVVAANGETRRSFEGETE